MKKTPLIDVDISVPCMRCHLLREYGFTQSTYSFTTARYKMVAIQKRVWKYNTAQFITKWSGEAMPFNTTGGVNWCWHSHQPSLFLSLCLWHIFRHMRFGIQGPHSSKVSNKLCLRCNKGQRRCRRDINSQHCQSEIFLSARAANRGKSHFSERTSRNRLILELLTDKIREHTEKIYCWHEELK